MTQSSASKPLAFASERTPVMLVTGFLGSGKTTVIGRLLRDPAFARSAVIVNDYGEVDFNEAAFARSGPEIVAANAGCFCCTARAHIATAFDTLESQADGRRFDRVLVEASGLAEPAPVLQALINDPGIVRRYRLAAVVAVIDAVTGAENLAERREAREQILFADCVVISKIDVADAEDVAAIKARIGQINTRAPIIEAPEGRIDPQLVLRLADEEHGSRRTTDAGFRMDGGSVPSAGQVHGETPVQTWTIRRQEPATRAGLALWMDLMAAYRGSDVLRMKGILNVEGRPTLVESVRHVFHPPVELGYWPDGDRGSRVVVIAQGVGRETIERAFDALAFTPAMRPLDPAAYRRFQAVIARFRDP